MSMKEQFKAALQFSRNYSSGLFKNFESADEWVYQANPAANHALWCMGHIAYADNFWVSLFDSEKAHSPEGYKELFGAGSEPQGDASKYPAPEKVFEYFNERRDMLLALLDSFSEEDFAKATTGDVAENFPTYGDVLNASVWHETLHAGQASIASRGLNKPPLLR